MFFALPTAARVVIPGEAFPKKWNMELKTAYFNKKTA